MQNIKLFTLVGGISRSSLNKKFYNALIDLNLPGFIFETYDISTLPYYSQDLEMDPPDNVTSFKEKIREADAILIITPEYNRSYPGVLKNAIDWGSRPYGMNLWNDKAAGVLGASSGNIGTFGAQHHLRQVFSYLNMNVIGQPELYFNATGNMSDEGKIINDKSIHLIQKYFETFHDFIMKTNRGNYPIIENNESPSQSWEKQNSAH